MLSQLLLHSGLVWFGVVVVTKEESFTFYAVVVLRVDEVEQASNEQGF